MVLNPSITSDPQVISRNVKKVSSISRIKIDNKAQNANTRGTTFSPTRIGLLLEANKKIGVQSP